VLSVILPFLGATERASVLEREARDVDGLPGQRPNQDSTGRLGRWQADRLDFGWRRDRVLVGVGLAVLANFEGDLSAIVVLLHQLQDDADPSGSPT
jgi:hypothetical protein